MQVAGNLGIHLIKVLVDVSVSLLKLLLSKLSDLSLHHGLLVSEETVGASEEALEGDHLLQEAELGVGLLLGLGFLLLLDGNFDA